MSNPNADGKVVKIPNKVRSYYHCVSGCRKLNSGVPLAEMHNAGIYQFQNLSLTHSLGLSVEASWWALVGPITAC